jgi:type III secretion protein Q
MPSENSSSEASPRPLDIESVRPEFLRAAQRIAGRHRPVAFDWHGQPATLTLSSQPGKAPVSYTAKMRVDAHEVTLFLEGLPDVTSVSAAYAGLDLAALPPELACGVLAAAFESGLGQLKNKGLAVGLVELLPSTPPVSVPPESLTWEIAQKDRPGWVRGALAGNDAALQHLGTLMSRVPARPLQSFGSVPCVLTFVAGRMGLTQDEYRALRRSDAVLAELGPWRTEGRCEVRAAGRPFASATLQGQFLTIHHFTMTEPSPSPAPDTHLAAVDQLEVELTFLVGSHTTTLEHLKTLSPGACLELSTPVSQAVTICANGKPVGRGELLDIGSRIGVRITELAGS